MGRESVIVGDCGGEDVCVHVTDRAWLAHFSVSQIKQRWVLSSLELRQREGYRQCACYRDAAISFPTKT